MEANVRSAVKSALRLGVAVIARITHRHPASDTPRVLCYHGVCDDPPNEWSVTPAQLRAHLELLRRGCQPVTLDQIVDWHLGTTSVPRGAVAVTFDDGFVDVLDAAAPILDEFGVPGAVFVPSELVSGGTPDTSYRPTRPFMNWSQVSELAAAGWTIGSHSLTHPRLSALSDDESRRQLVDSRDQIEQRLGRDILLHAYPFGTPATVSDRDRRLAEEAGYRAAFMDTTGPLRQHDDTFGLPRSKVLGTDRVAVVRASLSGGIDPWRFIERRH